MTKTMARAATTALIIACAATPLAAHSYKLGALTITHPWSRETPPVAKTGGGYLKITNAGPTDDRLLGGSTPVAEKLEIHRMSMDGGVMRMRPVVGGLPLPAGKSVELAPGGYHIMLINLKAPLKHGQMIPATLRFAKAGAVAVSFQVTPIGARTPAEGGHDHGQH